jgi:uncharacterized protein YcaQ
LTNVHRLTRDEARRIAVRAQLLDADRPRDLLTVVEQLTFLQLDPTAAVAPAADLVAWSRLGNAYEPAHLQQALERDRSVFEYRGQVVKTEPIIVMIRAMADLGLYLADMAAARHSGSSAHLRWLEANDGFRQRVLELLDASGPLASRDIPDTAEEPWQSSGWTHDRNVTQMLEMLATSGVVAVAGRRGKQRLWDLAERVYPARAKVVPAAKAHKVRDEKWLRALGVARPKVVGDAGIPVEVEGTSGVWRVDPAATAKGFEGRTALLSPFDRLIHDRVRSVELFDFEYTLEMYKPKEKRRWGYFALPVLHDDRLVGKVDAIAERKLRVLQVNAVHEDVKFTRAMTIAVKAELQALAQWLRLDDVRYA